MIPLSAHPAAKLRQRQIPGQAVITASRGVPVRFRAPRNYAKRVTGERSRPPCRRWPAGPHRARDRTLRQPGGHACGRRPAGCRPRDGGEAGCSRLLRLAYRRLSSGHGPRSRAGPLTPPGADPARRGQEARASPPGPAGRLEGQARSGVNRRAGALQAQTAAVITASSAQHGRKLPRWHPDTVPPTVINTQDSRLCHRADYARCACRATG